MTHVLGCPPTRPEGGSTAAAHADPPRNHRFLLPDDLIQLTAMCWMREFIQLAGRVMLPYSSGILTAVLPCLAYDDRKKSILPSGEKQEQPQRGPRSHGTLEWATGRP